jgi:hypothetical protein
MSDLKSAAKLALEALKNAHSCTAQEYDNAIKALEEALAKQEQGEQAILEDWLIRNRPSGDADQQKRAWEDSGEYADLEAALVAQQAQEQVEPMPLYTTPPQRTWVGLTDDEIDQAWRSVDHTIPYAQFRIDVAKAIEAKLKEKNYAI